MVDSITTDQALLVLRAFVALRMLSTSDDAATLFYYLVQDVLCGDILANSHIFIVQRALWHAIVDHRDAWFASPMVARRAADITRTTFIPTAHNARL
jgi:hypothetical protein